MKNLIKFVVCLAVVAFASSSITYAVTKKQAKTVFENDRVKVSYVNQYDDEDYFRLKIVSKKKGDWLVSDNQPDLKKTPQATDKELYIFNVVE